jgi:hypothetical protein
MLARSKFEYDSVVWNIIMSTDANRHERIQQKLATICFCHFFPYISYSYAFASDKLSLHFLHRRRYDLGALFCVQVYHGLKSCNSVVENIRVRAPTRCIRDFAKFGVSSSNKHRSSARCACAANAVGKDLDIFAIGAVSLNHIL